MRTLFIEQTQISGYGKRYIEIEGEVYFSDMLCNKHEYPAVVAELNA